MAVTEPTTAERIAAIKALTNSRPCSCHSISDTSRMSAAALESGAMSELWVCQRCKILEHLAALRADVERLEQEKAEAVAAVDYEGAKAVSKWAQGVIDTLTAELERQSKWPSTKLKQENERLRGLLKEAASHIAHGVACVNVRPTEEWAEHGSLSFEDCNCILSKISAALHPPTINKEEK